MSMPGLIVVDGTDPDAGDYSQVTLPPNWTLRVAKERGEVGGRMEELFRTYPTAKFYSIVNDDVVPETPHWDTELAAAAGDWNVAYPWDMLTGMGTQFLVGGKLVRAVGSFSLGFIHTMVDRAWMDIGQGIGRLIFRKDVHLRHEHWSRDRSLRDKTYSRSFNGMATIPYDKALYAKWYAEDLPKLIERLKKEIEEDLKDK